MTMGSIGLTGPDPPAGRPGALALGAHCDGRVDGVWGLSGNTGVGGNQQSCVASISEKRVRGPEVGKDLDLEKGWAGQYCKNGPQGALKCMGQALCRGPLEFKEGRRYRPVGGKESVLERASASNLLIPPKGPKEREKRYHSANTK